MPTLLVLATDGSAQIAESLRRLDVGEVYFDLHHRMLYATDASNYQVQPLGVVVVRDPDAMEKLVAFCGKHKLPLLLRGGGTSLAGQCTNRAIVVDHSNHCREILECDVAARTCHVQPGIGVDDLNRWLKMHAPGMFFAPDPATSAQATVGGCIGNNAAGARSIRYGRTSENVAALDIALSSGERFWIGPGTADARARALAQAVSRVVEKYAALIRARFPKTVRRNAGYALDMILSQMDRGVAADALDLTGLICGSEGTLAAVLGAKLKLHPIPAARGLAIVSFNSIEAAIAAVQPILNTGPSAVELLDEVVLEAAAGNAQTRGYLDLLPRAADGLPSAADGLPRAVLYVEYQDQLEESFERLREVAAGQPMQIYNDQGAVLRAWALRKAAEPLVHNLSAHRKPVTLIEDNAIPVENLGQFVAQVKAIVARHGTFASYYAHASVGVLHIRPMLDLHEQSDREKMQSIAVEVADVARSCGGVMSGEHGDGRVRGPLLERFYGPELMRAFAEIKAIFDPAQVMNPGMIVNAGEIATLVQQLRVHPREAELPWPGVRTYFDYSDQEGFQGALEMCNGAGVCRKMSGGTMCPSYRATLDERHSTRGRANALRLAISGQLTIDQKPAWHDPQVQETLDLCLSCKACKSECPSNVDVAKLKAEYTAQKYRAGGGPTLQAWVFGHVRLLNRLAAMMPGLANALMRAGPLRALANRVLKLAPQRTLPEFAPSFYRTARLQAEKHSPAVALYADCFTTYNEPHLAHAAIEVLQALGYGVRLPRVGCCGRAMISNGLLPDAITTIDRTLEQLRPAIEDRRVLAILVVEPSCLAAMKDEWLTLKLRTPRALRQACADKAMLVEDFVQRRWDHHPIPPGIMVDESGPPVLMHGHCHQKALWGEESSAGFLHRLVGSRLRVLPSGCCGMAGSFGFLREHWEISQTIFAQSLGGLLGEGMIVAPGTSCRHQIRDATGRRAVHPIEVMHAALLRSHTSGNHAPGSRLNVMNIK